MLKQVSGLPWKEVVSEVNMITFSLDVQNRFSRDIHDTLNGVFKQFQVHVVCAHNR